MLFSSNISLLFDPLDQRRLHCLAIAAHLIFYFQLVTENVAADLRLNTLGFFD